MITQVRGRGCVSECVRCVCNSVLVCVACVFVCGGINGALTHKPPQSRGELGVFSEVYDGAETHADGGYCPIPTSLPHTHTLVPHRILCARSKTLAPPPLHPIHSLPMSLFPLNQPPSTCPHLAGASTLTGLRTSALSPPSPAPLYHNAVL